MADDRDFIDVESDEDGLGNSGELQFENQADKRAHHNALERKRRDHIKESFNGLRDVIPTTAGERASRAQILKNATAYISSMKNKANKHQMSIEQLKEENKTLEEQVLSLEQMVESSGFASNIDNQSDDSLHEELQDTAPTKSKRKRVR